MTVGNLCPWCGPVPEWASSQICDEHLRRLQKVDVLVRRVKSSFIEERFVSRPARQLQIGEST